MRTPAVCLAAALAAAVSAAQPLDLGHLEFPTSAEGEAQEQFLRGVAALHSFWYEEAEKSFRRAREIDPGFAMAYWGEAMSHNHPLWEEQDLQAARAVLRELGRSRSERLAKAATDRERAWLEAVEILYGPGEKHERDLAYARAMAGLAERYPEDHEAATFHALSILGTVQRGDTGYRRQMRSAAILEPVFRENPDHPGAAHYLIHSYDDPDHAPLGLPAAERYADIAPAAHHALHMPTHIFVQLGMWEGVARSNRRSYDASDAWVRREGLSFSKRDFHSLSWLSYAQLMLGRYEASRATVEEMRASAAETGDSRSLGYVDEMLARYVVESRDWQAAAGLEREAEPGRGRVQALLALGMAAARRGDPAGALRHADGLAELRAGMEAEGNGYRAIGIGVAEHEVRAVAAIEAGHADAALEQARLAVALEQKQDPPSGPPMPVKPAGELYAELLLEAGRPAEAEAQFRAALEYIPARSPSRLGLARAIARQDRIEEARRLYAELLEDWSGSDPELAALVPVTRAGS